MTMNNQIKNKNFKNRDSNDSQNTLTKKSSLVFKSGRRNVIYFEETQDNLDLGDLHTVMQSSGKKMQENRQKKSEKCSHVSKAQKITNQIIERMVSQGSSLDRQQILQSVEVMLSMPIE